jgi:predicted transcriptional regulator
MSSKYTDSMKILATIEDENTPQKPNHTNKQLIKTLTEKGYLERTAGYQKTGTVIFDLTEKGAKTLQEYNKIRKIMDKIREGTHPSTDHPDR